MRHLWRPLRGCVTTRPPKQVCTVAAPLASAPRDRADGMSPAASPRARRAPAARGERAKLAGSEGNIARLG